MPAVPIISDEVLLERLLQLFRDTGFEAASLERISDATGLRKSSLYHRFPRGKEQMAEEVAAFVERTFGSVVLAPVHDHESPVAKRIEAIVGSLRRFYQAGRKSCLLDVFSIDHISDNTSIRVGAAAIGWIEAFAVLAREAGLDRRLARERAEDAVVRIEGALVIARATGSTGAFDRALRRLVDDLTTV